MPKFVTSLAFSGEFLGVWELLKKKAREEGKPLGPMVEEILGDWAKKHLEGNPTFPLDKWAEDPRFLAWPAFGGDWSKVPLEKYDQKDLDNMEAKSLEVKQRIAGEIKRRWRVEN